MVSDSNGNQKGERKRCQTTEGRMETMNGKNGFWFSNQGWNQTRLDASGRVNRSGERMPSSVSHHQEQDTTQKRLYIIILYIYAWYCTKKLNNIIENIFYIWFQGWNRIGNQDRDGDSWSWFVSWLIFPSGLRSTLSDSENLTARDFIGCKIVKFICQLKLYINIFLKVFCRFKYNFRL